MRSMADFDVDPEAATGDAMQALTEAMIRVFETQLAELIQDKGAGSALAFSFASIPVCTNHLAQTMGAAYAVDYLEGVAKPLRDFLTEHGGPGIGVGH